MNKQLSMFDKEKRQLDIKNMDNPALLRDIPFDKIYEAARKEASRKKPAFFIHKYFARRITCNFRMMLLGLLLPYDEDIWNYIYDSYEHINLKDLHILDPFMGGGTTIFEGVRLNASVIGNDLQPLSKFVTTALVKEMDIESVKIAKKKVEKSVADQIKKYYKTSCPECGKTADVMYTFHVKKVKSDSGCKEHKLFSSFVLAFKKEIFTLVCPKCGDVFKHNFRDFGKATCRCGFIIETPKVGYVNRGIFKCDECGEEHVISEYTKDDGYPHETELIALEYYCPHCNSHDYKRIDKSDMQIYQNACQEYERIKGELPIPEQEIPLGYNTKQVLNHGYKKFSDLFNKRQLLCLGLLMQEINNIEKEDDKFWLQLAFSGMLEMNNMFCRYQASAYKICNIFFNHAYVPISMPVENNVWGSKLGTGNFVKTLDKIIRAKEFCSNIYDISTVIENGKSVVQKEYSNEKVNTKPTMQMECLDEKHPVLLCQDSRNLDQIDDKSVNIVLTDPPFGANVMYSELIDFFHVWNYKSTIATELGFTTPLAPKKDEIIVNLVQNKTQEDYEDGLTSVYTECHRVLTDNGYLIFSFHDKSVESWLSVLKSIDAAGFKLEKTYPLHAESRTGAHTSNKNSIALDIMLICRKKIDEFSKMITEESEAFIEKKAYENTEEKIKRLLAVNAEITISDIENIFLAEYFCLCSNKKINFTQLCKSDYLKECVNDLQLYFHDLDIKKRRSGWWSELYRQKWEV